MLTVVRGDRVRKVRARGFRLTPDATRRPDDDDALRLRRRVERMFAPADVRPPGAPPGAIICIRHARAPLPRPDSQWTHAIELGIRTLEGAHRPFVAPVPDAANVVLFLDDAELLACAARDGRRGSPAWWWTTLFGDAPLAAIVERELAATPAFVPAVLDLLDQRGACADAVAGLDDAFCVRLTQAVAAVHALTWLPRSTAMPSPPPATAASGVPASVPASAVGSGETRDAIARLLRPFARLSPPQRALVALGLSLRRLPAVAHRPAFMQALDEAVRVVHPVVTELAAHAGQRPPEPRGRISDRDAPPVATPLPVAARAEPVVRARPKVEWPPAASDASEPAFTAVTSREKSHEMAPLPPHATREPDAAIAQLSRTVAAVADVVHSEVAGIFYLVNVALRCGLYSDFTNPQATNLPVPLPELLAVAAQHTFGDDIVQDGIWRVLAEMSGRSVDRFEPRPPSRQEHATASPAGTFGEGGPDATLTEFDDVLATMREYISEAIDVAADAAMTFLCRQPGSIRVSPVRVDVTFSLAGHPIALRLAGLDRNPGWVPSAGRVIEFHYE